LVSTLLRFRICEPSRVECQSDGASDSFMLIILILLIFGFCISAQQNAPEATSPPPVGTIAFVDVKLVPMDAERVVSHQTVIVQGRQIVQIGPEATTEVPAGARRIDGHGTLYLMPGLADMHSHASRQDDLTLYVANGVTTILTLGNTPEIFVRETRGRITSGKEIGPTPYVAFFVDGHPPVDPSFFSVQGEDEARGAVIQAKLHGYDFIKVYNNIGNKEFYAILDEARRQHIAVVGHAVRSVELKDALNAGQVMVAHGEEYLYMYFHHDRDRTLALKAAQFTRAAGAYVIPNLSAYEAISLQWGKPEQVKAFLTRPEAKFLTPCLRHRWANDDYVQRAGTLDGNLQFLRIFTKTLSDTGVPLMLGTDSPNIPGMFAGYSIHDDLRNMVESGLTPYEALSSGTRIPGQFIAKFVPGAESFGTISIGARADLLLLRNNPMESVNAVREPVGVMAAGHWMPGSFLRALLDRYANQFHSAPCDE
jgi:Amidohydrolase family